MTVTQGYRKVKYRREKINQTEKTGDRLGLHSLFPLYAPGARGQVICLLAASATSVVRNQVEAAHLSSAHAEGFAPTSQVLGRETDTRPSLD